MGKDGKKNTKFNYWFKAFKWFMGNSMFGIFPLFLMLTVNTLTDGRAGEHEVNHLIYEGGVVLFVMIAIMGSVTVDYLLSGFTTSGLAVFAIYYFPLVILGFVSLEFVLICMKLLDKETFGLTSATTIIVVTLSFVYSTATKANLYIKEDSVHDSI